MAKLQERPGFDSGTWERRQDLAEWIEYARKREKPKVQAIRAWHAACFVGIALTIWILALAMSK